MILAVSEISGSGSVWQGHRAAMSEPRSAAQREPLVAVGLLFRPLNAGGDAAARRLYEIKPTRNPDARMDQTLAFLLHSVKDGRPG
jgi:hypothetical protein